MDEEASLLTGPAPARSDSLFLWLGTTALVTPVAALAGAIVGWCLVEPIRISTEGSAASAAVHTPVFAPGASLYELPPIITNLADPSETWVRLQTAIILDTAQGRKPELISAEVAEDILGYLRTISLASIQGPSGLRHLREDLNERARIRSDGKVRELVIRGLAVQ
jgi:flagellar FliL protein